MILINKINKFKKNKPTFENPIDSIFKNLKFSALKDQYRINQIQKKNYKK